MPREGAGDAVVAVVAEDAVVAVGVTQAVSLQGVEEAARQGVAVLAEVERRRAETSRHRLQAGRKPPGEASRQGLVSARPDRPRRV